MTYLVGRLLGRYQILEEIGRGGMARVYKAHDTQLQRSVALKVLAPQLAVDPEFAQRFEREAITAANLHHPNIVTIYDVGDEDGMRYFAMEFVAGRTLHAVIRERGALGLGPAVSIIAAVGAALDYAHRSGSIHRDIKPHNIMIHRDGRVLLTDFGIAQAPDRGDGGERLTRTGVFMGTPEYISPEQASAQRLDGRSDLYSLGITAYEIITGQVPFSGATPQLIVAHVQEPPPLPSSIDASLPPELDMVMRRILAKRPENRFGTADAFASALAIVARKNDIAAADRSQIAALALPQTSAGQPTTAVRREETQRDQQRGVQPTRDAARAAATATAPPRPPLDVTQPAPARPAAVSQARVAPPPAPAAPTNTFGPRTQITVASVVLVILFYLMSRGFNQNALPFVMPTARPVTPIRSTLSPTRTPTPTPTATATVTPAPPTATPAPPTPEPSRAPVIPPPALPTITPAPPPVQPTITPIPPTEPATPTEPVPATQPVPQPTEPVPATQPVPQPTEPVPATTAADAPTIEATIVPAPTDAAPTTAPAR